MDRALVGVPASPGIVFGPVHLLRWEVPDVHPRAIGDDEIDGELRRFREAVKAAKARLRAVKERAESHVGAEDAAIFEVQISVLEDEALLGEVDDFIRQNRGAEHAFDLVMLEWRRRFSRHTSPLMRERAGDLTDIHIRVLSILLGLPDHDPVDPSSGTGMVLVTHDLTPSLTVQLDREAIVGIATDAGTRTSHVAILARSLGIPAVVGLRDATSRLKGHERVVLDGTSGTLIVNPTASEIDSYQSRARAEAQVEEDLKSLANLEPVTLDGVRITLRANVDLPEEAEQAAHSGAEGVGLMRTEFLVVGRTTMPDEEEQYRAYARVIDAFGGQPVVIRTFDVGGDKLPVGGYPTEANPFLGWRAIRMCLDEPELFKDQLRALLRAGLHGDVQIMLPLVITRDEVRQARALLVEAAHELEARGVEYRRDIPLGVMVETPAAALAADTFADDVEFFSIGTNDLVQYTLAVDRGNANLASRFTALHPAVLRLIQRTVDVARQHGLDLSVCGEMASQPLMAYALIGLGLRTLSVAPRSVPRMKRLVRAIDTRIATQAATAALGAPTAFDAEAELRRRLREEMADLDFARDGLPGIG